VVAAAGREATCTSVERVFVDTNVLAYLFDDAEPTKQARARARLPAEQRERDLVISTQVLQELYVALTRGKAPIATPELAARAVRALAEGYTTVQVEVPLVLAAIETSQQGGISFWDALIIQAATRAGCRRLLTEDLNAGQTIEGVVIEDPFA
jgi:predicted nucleic acid-binding protein